MGGYFNQSTDVSVQAWVTARSCSQVSDSAEDGGTFTACNVSLLYPNAPDGTAGALQLPGVDANRIREQGGRETLLIYFANNSSETPISPQDIIPMWQMIFLVGMVGLPLAIGGAACLRAGFKRPSGRAR